jgi:phosphopentomutase
MDVNFRNVGTETLEHFINRYHQQLETMTKLSLQTASREYVTCLGHGYEG